MSVYSLNARKQLIDINEDLVNFEANIQVVCKELTPFEAIVVSQTQLDSGEPIEYKHVLEGMFQVSIRQDSGVYENFLLLLKSDSDAVVEVEMTVSPVEQAALPPVLQEPPIQGPASVDTYQSRPVADNKQKVAEKPGWFKRNWKYLVIAGLILIGGIVLWFMYLRKPSDPIKAGFVEKTNYDSTIYPALDGGVAYEKTPYGYREKFSPDFLSHQRGKIYVVPTDTAPVEKNQQPVSVDPSYNDIAASPSRDDGVGKLNASREASSEVAETVSTAPQVSDSLDPALLTKLQNILKK